MTNHQENTPADKSAATPTNSPQTNRKKWTLISAAVLCLIIAAIVAAVLVKKNQSSSSDSSPPSSSSSPGGSAGNSSAPSGPSSGNQTASSKLKLFGYYGQNAIANAVDIIKGTGSRTTAQSDWQAPLVDYCNSGLYDTINLAFLNLFGGGDNHFTINLAGFRDPNLNGIYQYTGGNTETNSAAVVQTYQQIGGYIKQCQAKGVKIVISLAGDRTVSDYKFVAGDGLRYATLWNGMFFGGSFAVKPFGDVVLDGIELDIEKNPDPTVWNAEMISLITNLKQLNTKTTVAVVPQCYLNGAANKDINVGDVIANAPNHIDYIIIQYYNNPVCSYPFNFNFNAWKSLYSGPMVVGLAGDWTSAISGGFLEPPQLQAVYDMIKNDPQFLGFSVYDVSSSNPPAYLWNIDTYSNPPRNSYSQILRNVLDGQIVGSGAPPQGAPISDATLSMRCGGTWGYANATCTAKKCTSNTDCGNSEQCFSFLRNC